MRAAAVLRVPGNLGVLRGGRCGQGGDLLRFRLGSAFLGLAWFFPRPLVVLRRRGITVRAGIVRYHRLRQAVIPRYRHTTTNSVTVTADRGALEPLLAEGFRLALERSVPGWSVAGARASARPDSASLILTDSTGARGGIPVPSATVFIAPASCAGAMPVLCS
ncbi:hypothetical protein ACH4NX_34410 [Streptomyces sp. NPDC017225]|uniref:hypothetical protein n=1 Tax=Streptomyces sp. NPDC017225 TaxID=3364982 RepID=UPI0037996AD6